MKNKMILGFSGISAVIVFLLWVVARVYCPVDVGIELFKALLELLVVVVFGSIASFIVNWYNLQRQRYEALREFRKTVLTRLNNAYARTKKARRLLRAKGLRKAEIAGAVRTVVQQTPYGQQMEDINDTQLSLEAIGTEINASVSSFTNAPRLVARIRAMDSYLNSMIDEYEEGFQNFADASITLEDLPRLSDFLGPYENSQFGKEFVVPYKEALSAVRQDILAIES
jgi:hypothetical protein